MEYDVKLFYFQAEDCIRDLVRSRGLGDVYKRQDTTPREIASWIAAKTAIEIIDAILADREEVA